MNLILTVRTTVRNARNMSIQKLDNRSVVPRLYTCPIYAYRAVRICVPTRSGKDLLCVPLGNVTILSRLSTFASSADFTGRSVSSALPFEHRLSATFHSFCMWLGGTTWSMSPLSISIGSEAGNRATFDAEFQRCVHRHDMWRSTGIPLTMSGIDVKVFSTISADTWEVPL